jgi:hypothetical protein
MSVQPPSSANVRIRLSIAERDRYVRWWLESSGLSRAQLRAIASALFNERPDEPAITRRPHPA